MGLAPNHRLKADRSRRSAPSPAFGVRIRPKGEVDHD